jgi:hypothetical protein
MQAVESNMSRRRLLGSALTLGAGAAIGSTLSFPSIGVPLAAAGRPDLVHDELIRQLKHAVGAMGGARPGEAARGAAGTLRLLAAHYRATGVDDQLRTRLRAAVGREGRNTVLQWEVDATALSAQARRFGITVPLPREAFDLTARERALAGALTHGCTPALLATAAELTRLAPDLERRGVTAVAARQCADVQGTAPRLEFIALASDLLDPSLHAGFDGAYLAFKLSLYMLGC